MVTFPIATGVIALQSQASAISNVGFLGLPMIAALLGKKAAVAVVLALLVDMVIFMPVTLFILEIEKNRNKAFGPAINKIVRGTVFNSFILSIGIGVLFSTVEFKLPTPINSFTSLLGAAASPCALFALGASLAGRLLFRDFKEASYLASLKLFIHPLAIWLAMTYIFDVRPMWATAVILVAGLPIAGNVFIIARTYSTYTERSSTAILLSTGIAAVTFSILVGIIT